MELTPRELDCGDGSSQVMENNKTVEYLQRPGEENEWHRFVVKDTGQE